VTCHRELLETELQTCHQLSVAIVNSMRTGTIHVKIKEVIVRLSGFFKPESVALYLGISASSVRRVLRTFHKLGVPSYDKLPNAGERRILGASEDLVNASLSNAADLSL